MILETLSKIIHPAADKDIVSLGLVEDIKLFDGNGAAVEPTDPQAGEKAVLVRFKLVVPSPDPLLASVKKECEKAMAAEFPHAKISIIELVRERKPTKKTVNELDDTQLRGIGKIIAIASGKGGVGKSTVSVNLAVALSLKGYRVGLVDADVYGPSIPKMTGTEGQVPYMDEEKDLIVPLEKWGIKLLSIGHLVAPEQALIWRGPMASNAMKQIVMQVDWGELDYLLIDLPPGTGDIHISMVHDIPLTGAVIVTTPQQVAIADVIKSINMFRHKDVNVPILGLVENMAWFTPAEHPEEKYYIFGKDGGRKMAEELSIPLLGSIPIYMSVEEGGDAGRPAAFSDGPDAAAGDPAAHLPRGDQLPLRSAVDDLDLEPSDAPCRLRTPRRRTRIEHVGDHRGPQQRKERVSENSVQNESPGVKLFASVFRRSPRSRRRCCPPRSSPPRPSASRPRYRPAPRAARCGRGPSPARR